VRVKTLCDQVNEVSLAVGGYSLMFTVSGRGAGRGGNDKQLRTVCGLPVREKIMARAEVENLCRSDLNMFGLSL